MIASFLEFTSNVTNRNDSRSALAEALKRALSGDHDPVCLQDSISSPQGLTLLEKSAWLQLQNWASDEQLRTQFAKHAEFSRKRMNELLVQLED